MSRLFYHVMQDNAGNLLFDVSGTMRLAGTGTVATIYGDEALTVVLPNPMTNHPSFGSFKCFLAPGDYDFQMAKAGYTFETLTGVQGHGTMAQQNEHEVSISGGTIAALTSLGVAGDSQLIGSLGVSGASQLLGLVGIGGAQEPGFNLKVHGTSLFTGPLNTANAAITGGTIVALTSLGVAGDSQLVGSLGVSGASQLTGLVGIGGAQEAGWALRVFGRVHLPLVMGAGGVPHLLLEYDKVAGNGITLRQQNGDVGGGAHCGFQNNAGALVGEIISTGTTTAYNTTSDARLKHDVEPLSGALDVVRALNPVAFRWRLDESPGRGFLAHEVAEVVDGVITGEKDALDEEGNIQAQMIDYSKLVPYLIGAVKELTQQVEMLQAQLAAAGA